MTADDARKLVQHRFDRLIKNIDEKITEAALKGQYSFEYYIYIQKIIINLKDF